MRELSTNMPINVPANPHTTGVLVAVTIGGNIAGIVGMIFSIPFCSVLYQLFSEIVNKQIKKKNVDIP